MPSSWPTQARVARDASWASASTCRRGVGWCCRSAAPRASSSCRRAPLRVHAVQLGDEVVFEPGEAVAAGRQPLVGPCKPRSSPDEAGPNVTRSRRPGGCKARPAIMGHGATPCLTCWCHPAVPAAGWREPSSVRRAARPLRRRLYEPAGRPLGLPAAMPAGLVQVEWCATFSGPVRTAIHALKYRGERRLVEPLAAALAERWQRAGAGGDLLTWAPVHPSRGVSEASTRQSCWPARRPSAWLCQPRRASPGSGAPRPSTRWARRNVPATWLASSPSRRRCRARWQDAGWSSWMTC